MLIAASLPAVFAASIAASMQTLLPQVDPSSPYFSALRPGMLYVGVPLVFSSACILVMAPGLLLSLAVGRPRNWAEWLLEGFGIDLVLVSALAAALQGALGAPLMGGAFVACLLLVSLGAGVALERRVASGAVVASPIAGDGARFALTSVLVVPALLAVALTPKIFWEAFNGDGAHAFESTRLLLHHALPFWSPLAGDVSSWPGIAGLVSVYEVSWFMRLFGENEAAVRLPLLFNLALLFAAVVAAAQAGTPVRLTRPALALIWGGVVSFGLVMSYSATYDPYCADLSMPGVMDTLVMVQVLAAATAYANGRPRGLLAWSLLALMTGPAGLLQLGAAIAGMTLAHWPWPWRRALRYAGGLFACLVALTIAPAVLGQLGLQTGGSEHGPVRFLFKFGFLATADFERIAWSLLPAGIYPVAVVFAWRRADELSRILLVVAGLLFAMYYVMGFVSLHYFVPVMLLPLVAFWRTFGDANWGTPAWLACSAGVALALACGLPAGTGIYTGTRDIGEKIEVVGLPDYHAMEPEIFAASQRLEALFPKDMDPRVPDSAYGGSPLAWLFYAERAADTSTTNYRLAATGLPVPDAATRVEQDEMATVSVFDLAEWQEDRHLNPTNSNGQWVYAVERNRLFNRGEGSKRFGFFGPGNWLLGVLESRGWIEPRK